MVFSWGVWSDLLASPGNIYLPCAHTPRSTTFPISDLCNGTPAGSRTNGFHRVNDHVPIWRPAMKNLAVSWLSTEFSVQMLTFVSLSSSLSYVGGLSIITFFIKTFVFAFSGPAMWYKYFITWHNDISQLNHGRYTLYLYTCMVGMIKLKSI